MKWRNMAWHDLYLLPTIHKIPPHRNCLTPESTKACSTTTKKSSTPSPSTCGTRDRKGLTLCRELARVAITSWAMRYWWNALSSFSFTPNPPILGYKSIQVSSIKVSGISRVFIYITLPIFRSLYLLISLKSRVFFGGSRAFRTSPGHRKAQAPRRSRAPPPSAGRSRAPWPQRWHPQRVSSFVEALSDDLPGGVSSHLSGELSHEIPSGYGSIPINTIFSGMNIHKSQLFWGSLGTRVLTHPHMVQWSWSWRLDDWRQPLWLRKPPYGSFQLMHMGISFQYHFPVASARVEYLWLVSVTNGNLCAAWGATSHLAENSAVETSAAKAILVGSHRRGHRSRKTTWNAKHFGLWNTKIWFSGWTNPEFEGSNFLTLQVDLALFVFYVLLNMLCRYPMENWLPRYLEASVWVWEMEMGPYLSLGGDDSEGPESGIPKAFVARNLQGLLYVYIYIYRYKYISLLHLYTFISSFPVVQP